MSRRCVFSGHEMHDRFVLEVVCWFEMLRLQGRACTVQYLACLPAFHTWEVRRKCLSGYWLGRDRLYCRVGFQGPILETT